MSKIKVVQIDGSNFLDDKGRVWAHMIVTTTLTSRWKMWDLPDEPQESNQE